MRKLKIVFICLCVILTITAVYTISNYNKASLTPSNSSYKSSNNTKSKTPDNISKAVEFKADAIKQRAEDFTLKDINGKEVALKDIKGKNVFLNFWATWCPPCRSEMPDIEKLYQETKNSDLVILTVNIAAQGDNLSKVKVFVNNNSYNFTVLYDSEQTVSSKYKIYAIPTSFFIDKNGIIVNKKEGELSLAEMRTYVNALDK